MRLADIILPSLNSENVRNVLLNDKTMLIYHGIKIPPCFLSLHHLTARTMIVSNTLLSVVTSI